MLQVRHRYLQARRNLEYELLKEQERANAAAPVEPATASLACPKCHREFQVITGLKSHIRNRTCEGT